MRTASQVLSMTLCVTLLLTNAALAQVTAEAPPDQPAAEQPELTPEQQAAMEKFEAAMAALEDTAFDSFVSSETLREAYVSVDVEMLTDCALQLAEGERVLLRDHRSGVTANALLDFGVRTAITKGETDQLDRLAKAAQKLGADDLAQRISASRKLVDQARSTTESFGDHQWVVAMIQKAELLGDTKRLDVAAEQIPNELPDEKRKEATDMLAEARNRISTAKSNDALKKLDASSRIWAPVSIGYFIPDRAAVNNGGAFITNVFITESLLSPKHRFSIAVFPAQIVALGPFDDRLRMARISCRGDNRGSSPRQATLTCRLEYWSKWRREWRFADSASFGIAVMPGRPLPR